jgi:hypothetical protein
MNFMIFAQLTSRAHRSAPSSPRSQRGTAQAPDVFMQLVESSNTHYQQVRLDSAFPIYICVM